MSIGDGCQYKGVVMHEIFHVLGRWHEHSRSDRDSYIIVNYSNIRNGMIKPNFPFCFPFPSPNFCLPPLPILAFSPIFPASFADYQNQFERSSTSRTTTSGIPYDFSSIMHYSAYSFSRNGQPTIEPRDSSISLRSLGQRRELSSKDLQHVQAIYCQNCECYRC